MDDMNEQPGPQQGNATGTSDAPTQGPRVTGQQMRDVNRLRRSRTDRYELVRIDPDDGTVTGRVAIGRDQPQTIVPIGKELWVITGRGDVVRVSQG